MKNLFSMFKKGKSVEWNEVRTVLKINEVFTEGFFKLTDGNNVVNERGIYVKLPTGNIFISSKGALKGSIQVELIQRTVIHRTNAMEHALKYIKKNLCLNYHSLQDIM